MQHEEMAVEARNPFSPPLGELCDCIVCLKKARVRVIYTFVACLQQEGLTEMVGESEGEEREGGWPPFCGFLRDVSGVRSLSRTGGHETASPSLLTHTSQMSLIN